MKRTLKRSIVASFSPTLFRAHPLRGILPKRPKLLGPPKADAEQFTAEYKQQKSCPEIRKIRPLLSNCILSQEQCKSASFS